MSTYIPWTIRHFDVESGLAPLSREEGPFFAVFWRGDTPLGHAWISRDQLPLTSEEIAHRISRLGPQNTPESVHKPAARASIREGANTVAVVIPTHRRADALARCLSSVARLSERPHEIVVVDNSAGDDATRQVVARFAGVRYVVEPKQGASIARNTGFAVTKSDIVAFLDDDETVHPGWTAALTSTLASGEFGLATGLVLPASLQSPAQYLFEKRFSFVRGYDRRSFSPDIVLKDRSFAPWHLGGSGNLAVRRSVFERVGGFDARLGAGRSGCSEDTDFFQRVLESGTACCYDPHAVVFHEHRTDLRALKSQAFKYMRGHAVALLIARSERRDPYALRRLLWSLPAYYAASFVRLFRGDPGLRAGLVLTEVAGCLSGIAGFALHAAGRNVRSLVGNLAPSKSIQSSVSV